MIRDSLEALQRNLSTLALYIGITTAYYLLKTVGEQFLVNTYKLDSLTSLPQAYIFCSGIVTAALYASIQAVAFTRFGQDLDRPYWKVASGREGFTRFFAMWFLLNLSSMALLVGSAMLPLTESSRAFVQLLWLFWAACYPSIGATIMFYGHLGGEEIRQALTTIGQRFSSYVLIFFLAFCAIILVLFLAESGMPLWAKPGLSILDGYMDCFIFACSWYICRIHRDTQDEHDDEFPY